MDQEETRVWLRRGRGLRKNIEALQQSKLDAFESATSTTAQAGASRSGSDVSRKAERFAILSAEIDRQIRELDQIMAEITSAISLVGDPTLRTILLDRYVRCLHWDEIGRHVGYSPVHVHRLHHDALDALNHVMECYTDSVL